MLYYVMLCFVMLCYVMSCYVMLCHVMFYCVCKEEPYREGEQYHTINVILTCRVRIRNKLLPESDSE